MKHFRFLFALVLLLLLSGRQAMAEERHLLITEPAGERIFGLGTSIGTGFSYKWITNLTDPSLELEGVGLDWNLPTLDFRFFRGDNFSVDLSLSLFDSLMMAFFTGGFYFNTDLFFTFYLGTGRVRGIIGPGLGLDVLLPGKMRHRLGNYALSPKIAVRAGLEVLSPSRRFGVRMTASTAARYVHISAREENDHSFANGVIFELGITGYSVTGSRWRRD